MRMRKEVFILNIDDILPNRFQPRIKFDEKAIMELAESIKKHGVIQPIIVRKIADKYEIIAGERRYKASIIAGRKTIPAIITDVDDKESAEIALIENVQRQDMTPIEEAISYKKVLDMGYLNQSELALKLGKTQSTIANKLRLLNLSDEVQEALLEEKISERHARSLLKLTEKQQPEILNKIINERLTVRKTDQLINNMLNIEEKTNNKEKKGDNMNNNYNDINNNFNIPTQPIIDNTNPGFMNIDNIQNNAEDITPVQNESVGERQPFNPFGPQPVEQPAMPEVGPNPFGPQPVEQPAMPEVGPNPFEIPQPMNQQPSFASMPNYPLPESQELTPLMPETIEQANRVEINTVINTLRDCIRQIEGMGYKVDSDELDLPNTYEFTIKIEKN